MIVSRLTAVTSMTASTKTGAILMSVNRNGKQAVDCYSNEYIFTKCFYLTCNAASSRDINCA